MVPHDPQTRALDGCAQNQEADMTYCWRCGEYCFVDDGKIVSHPHILDFDGIPSCPDGMNMPLEFSDSGAP